MKFSFCEINCLRNGYPTFGGFMNYSSSELTMTTLWLFSMTTLWAISMNWILSGYSDYSENSQFELRSPWAILSLWTILYDHTAIAGDHLPPLEEKVVGGLKEAIWTARLVARLHHLFCFLFLNFFIFNFQLPQRHRRLTFDETLWQDDCWWIGFYWAIAVYVERISVGFH